MAEAGTVRRALDLAARGVLGALLVWAGLSKLADPLRTLASVYGYELALPDAVAVIVAASLPWFELLLGLALLAGVWTREVLLHTTGLMGLFVLITGQAWVRGLTMDCGCFNLAVFGLDVPWLQTPQFATARNAILFALSAWQFARAVRTE